MAVHGIDAARQFAEDRRLIARSGAHFEHLVAGADLQGLRHQPHHGRLADGLSAGDGQGHVLVGAGGKQAANERATVDRFHGFQHGLVRHALGAQGIEELHLALSDFVFGHVFSALRRSIMSWAVRSARIGVTVI